MKKWIALGLFGVVSVVAACSGKSSGGYSQFGDGGTGAVYTGGYGGTGGTPMNTGGTPTVDLNAPSVEIISPVAVDDPGNDGVVVNNDVDVVCSVNRSTNPGSTDVDTSTVSIEMFSADGVSLEKKKGAATANAHEFLANFVLTDVPNGRASFRCSAKDSGNTPLTGTTGINTFVDHGPKITVVSPVPDSAFTALEGDVPVEFTVEPSPLTPDDDNAGVDAVTFSLDGQDIPAIPDPSTPGKFSFNVSLNQAPFTTPPSGVTPVQITASNHRTPQGAIRVQTYDFTIDGSGPTITVASPKDKIVVGGNVALKFKVTDDAAGVDENTVVVSINEQDYPFDTTQNWTRDGDDFTFNFDSANAGTSKVQVTVNIRASDKVGNASPGTSLLLYLDNVPPTVDLDPANMREGDRQTLQCSASFDPVGDAAINDLDGSFGLQPDGAFKHFPIGVAARFRAFVFEETNTIQGISVLHYAGTDASKVRLYVQPNPAAAVTPLLIDKSGDGICDEIGDVDNINFSVMDKVSPAGSIRYGIDPAIAPDPGTCVLKAANAPKTLCTEYSDMWHVLRHEEASSSETIIYSVKVNTGLECTGIDWEFGTFTNADGWVCFAARAVDNVGNIGISRPLRACVDDPNRPGEPPCKTASTIPPSCTDGCTPPPRANPGVRYY